jgi:hypothetical protein
LLILGRRVVMDTTDDDEAVAKSEKAPKRKTKKGAKGKSE